MDPESSGKKKKICVSYTQLHCSIGGWEEGGEILHCCNGNNRQYQFFTARKKYDSEQHNNLIYATFLLRMSVKLGKGTSL